MINTLTIFHELQETLDSRAAEKIAEVIGNVYEELHNTVTKEEFRELTNVVRELSEAQKQTETKVSALAAAQEKLTQAQERTDARLERLAQAQERTEVNVAELAEAQRHMERAIQQLAEDLRQTRQELTQKIDATNAVVGGISATIGYGLEDKAYQCLPELLQRDFGITVEGPLYRRFVKDNTG